MPSDAPIILAELWAEKTNAETRAFMRRGHLRDWAQDYLGDSLSDDESAACAAADVARVLEFRGVPEDADSWGRDRASWAAAARGYHEARGSRLLEVETAPHELARLHRLLSDDVAVERAWRELSKPAPAPTSTLQAAESLLQAKDPARMRRWLSRHSAPEREAILRHLKRHKNGGGCNG